MNFLVNRVTTALTCLFACTLLVSCGVESGPSTDPSEDASASPSATEVPTQPISLGVFGHERELEAFDRAIGRYNTLDLGGEARLRRFADAEAVGRLIDSERELPDVFMIDAPLLQKLVDSGRSQPLSSLLDERGVQFGDDFKREALLQFSEAEELQCMPYHASPMVMYINTDLIDLTQLEALGVEPPTRPYTWNLEQFGALVENAARPRRGIYGTTVTPTFAGMEPFLAATGTAPYDDERAPTTLALANPDIRDNLTLLLEILRNPRLLIPDKEKRTPLELFKAGRLATMPGYRDLVPTLRDSKRVNFDVMPLPSNARSATVAKFKALCMSADTDAIAAAADLIALLITPESMSDVARQGFLVPSSALVSESEAFIQPTEEPLGAVTFNDVLRSAKLAPRNVNAPLLGKRVNPLIRRLLDDAVLDLETLLTAIDEASVDAFEPIEE